MRLIDADKLQKAIPAEEDSITGIGMTYDEMEAYNDGIDEQWKKIVNAPTIEPEQQWIPSSERLPEKEGKVIVTYVPFAKMPSVVCVAKYSDPSGVGKPCFWIGEIGKNSFENISKQVPAWMPMPERYQEEGEQDGNQ